MLIYHVHVELRAEFKDENIDFSAVCMNWWMGSCTKDLPPCPPPDSFEKLLKLRENKEQLDERIHKFFHKLIALPHKHIVIVGHSSFFKRMLRMNRKLSNCEIYQASLQEICQGHGINWQGSIQK
jgi:broad specificity phosphatase PhoE